MIYLIEIEPYDPAAGQTVTLRFGSAGYTTGPADTPPNAWFEDRVQDPGNYERHLFGVGRTRGESSLDGGTIELVNAEGALDWMLDLTFDGRALRLYGLPDARSAWAERETIFVGTMEQVEFPSRKVTILIRDRLALLREAIQPVVYLGTTVAGGRADAEGNTDLKDVKKPMLFGRAFNVTPVTVDQFQNVYQVASNALSAISTARDSGVPLQATQDYPTLAALKAALMTGGQYATCLALGLLRTYTRPDGVLTVDATEGATLADRSAARIARRMIGSLVPVEEADFDALHALNPAECGLWVGDGTTTVLSNALAVLNSIGAYLTVDRFGAIRVGRLDLPSGSGDVTLDRSNVLDRGEALSRNATSDDGAGVPARSLTLRYARSNTVFSENDLKDVATDDAFRAFAKQEWRLAKVESEANKVLHPKGPELVFDTCLVSEADAMAEATRFLAIYGARRDLFRIAVSSDEVSTVDLNDVVTLRLDRFGMASGRALRVLGVTPTLITNTTEIEAWG